MRAATMALQYLTVHTPHPFGALPAPRHRAPDRVRDKHPRGSLQSDALAGKPPTDLLCDSARRNSTLVCQIQPPPAAAEAPPAFQLIHERTTRADTSVVCCSM